MKDFAFAANNGGISRERAKFENVSRGSKVGSSKGLTVAFRIA